MSATKFAKTKLALIVLITFFSTTILAQPLGTLAEDVKSGVTESAIKNLAVGIQSDNTGLKECSIYLAGFYEINELTKALVKQLKKETDANTKILIVLSLYRIGDKTGLEAIESFVNYDTNPHTKEMKEAMLNQLNIDSPTSNIEFSER